MPETPWKIVIVEDTFDDMQIMATTLEYHALEVHATRTVRECVSLMEGLVPDLVITDLAMPNGDGWAVLDAVRTNPRTARVPVVAVTAYHSPKLADDVLHGGFDGYFPKPINTSEFVEALWRILRA